MTQKELIEQLNTTFGKTKVDKLKVILAKQEFIFRDLIDLTFNADKTIAYRAAWLLENLILGKSILDLNDLSYLFIRLKTLIIQVVKGIMLRS